MSTQITATDLFCGGGGSSQGLHAAGVDVVLAANHWRLAVDSHNANFPDTLHDCADISQVEPRRYPRTTMLWASPSCTAQSSANTLKGPQTERPPADDELYPPLPDDAAARSRATMWDVVRMSEFHRYRMVLVENVVEAATNWVLFQPWIAAMRSLGYEHKIISLNSMFAGGTDFQAAAQSRDRLYVAFWRAGDTAPDFDVRPAAFCQPCGQEVAAVQQFKRPDTVAGKYRKQYLYHCPRCTQVVEPYTRAASEIIDWSLPSQRIGDRDRPLADKTMARINAGLVKFGGHLMVPVEGRDGKVAQPVDGPMRTQTARNETGVLGVPFFAELRGGGSHKVQRPVSDPLATVTASGNHHGLVVPPGFVMRNNGSKGDGGEHNTSFAEPFRTMTTKGHQSIVTTAAAINVEDCSFRMLQPHEVGAAMAFGQEYVVLGNKREQVRMYGNAVTPPAAQLLAERAMAALSGMQLAA
jgi:DNA (cytosine-5)-methyltransferase 1